MPHQAIAHIDKTCGSMLFRGFHCLPERASDGWVYWMPRYLLHNTGLTLYFLTNENELLRLDRDETLTPVSPDSLESVDIFFGRTVNSFDPENRLIRSARLKIAYPISSKVPESYARHNVVVVEDDTFIKPIPGHDRQFFYYDRTKKEEFLLYPAAFYKLKGQLKFIRKVSKRALAGRKIVFCGSMKSESYGEECFDLLRKKGIAFDYLRKVSKKELGELYRKAALTIFFSNGDFNPRVFYESIACGTPCLMSNDVVLAEQMEQYAFRTSSLLLNRNIRKRLTYPESLQQQLAAAAAALTEETCYGQLFSYVLGKAQAISQ